MTSSKKKENKDSAEKNDNENESNDSGTSAPGSSKEQKVSEVKDDRDSSASDHKETTRSDPPKINSKEINISSIFQHMNALVHVIQSGLRIDPKYIHVDLSAYGPKELEPIPILKELDFWDCHSIGDDHRLFISRRFLATTVWTNCDEYLHSLLNEVLPWAMQYSRLISFEPSKKPVATAEIYSLDDVGVDISSFSENAVEYDAISKQLIPFLTPLPMSVVGLRYFTQMRISHPKNLCDLRNAFFILMNSVRLRTNQDFLNEYTRTRDGVKDTRYMHRLDPRIYHNPYFSPVNLNSIISSIPRGIELSYTLIHSTSLPEITTVPISVTQLSSNVGVSTSRMSFVNTLMTTEYESKMENGIFAFITYHITPGVVEINLDFEDLLPNSENAFLVACMAKMLFSYDVDKRWNNITECSARNVDAIIMLYMITNRMIEPVCPNVDTANRRFTDYRRVERSKYRGRYYEQLDTNGDGRGWANAAGKFYGDGDITIYNSCARRQIFVFNFDQPIHEGNITEAPVGSLHPTMEALMEVIEASDSKYSEFKKFFTTTYNRYITYIYGINNFNRLNWYTGFRVTETTAANQKTYTDITRSVTMGWRAITVILKNFDHSSIGSRKTPYPVQFQYESAFVHDYAMLAVRDTLLREVINNRLGILNQYKANEITKMAISGIYERGLNPLRSFINVLIDLRALGSFTPSMSLLDQDTEIYLRTVLAFMHDVNSLVCATDSSACIDRLLDVEKIFTDLCGCADKSVPYVIPMQFNAELVLNPVTMTTLIKNHNALYYFMRNRRECIHLAFPIRYIAMKTDHPVNDEQFIKITYDPDPMKNDFRRGVSFSAIKVYISTPSRLLVAKDPETVIANLPTRITSGFVDDTATSVLVSVNEWASRLIADSGIVNVIRMPQIGFCSILTPDVVTDQVTVTVKDNIDFNFVKTL